MSSDLCSPHRELAISQRDTNYYDFLNEEMTQKKVLQTVSHYWEAHISKQWNSTDSCESSAGPLLVYPQQ
jgi:hypothetical protein